jgi:hypothetical protein
MTTRQYYNCDSCFLKSFVTYEDCEGAYLVFKRINEDHEKKSPGCTTPKINVSFAQDVRLDEARELFDSIINCCVGGIDIHSKTQIIETVTRIANKGYNLCK